MKKYQVTTKKHSEMVEITDQLKSYIAETGISEGVLMVQSLHTTAGLTINENADPDVVRDMLGRFEDIYPWEHPDDRHMEGNTAAHLKTSAVGVAQTIIVSDGRLVLGTWQGVYFCEFDGPRERRYAVTHLSKE